MIVPINGVMVPIVMFVCIAVTIIGVPIAKAYGSPDRLS
jgi:hypothetical protein